ncbi:MAG: hypothetical protein KAT43_02645 [Nanoarchaeota archaeon]|nr:hypothetical protein [Nanoarchaeota archaeon]
MGIESLLGGMRNLLGSTVGKIGATALLGAGLLFGGGCDEEEARPPEVPDFAATAGHQKVNLVWEYPDYLERPGVMIRRDIDDFPTDEFDGVLVYEGSGTEHTDSGLTQNILYFYKAFFFTYTEPTNYTEERTSSATAFYETDPPFHIPTVLINASIIPEGEADAVSEQFISRLDWDDYFDTIGCLPDVNHKGAVWTNMSAIRNSFTSSSSISSHLGYSIRMSDGSVILIGNTSAAGFSDNYKFSGIGWDGAPDIAALFTSTNGAMTLLTQDMMKEYFGSSIASRNYSGVTYNARSMAINITCDLFSSYGYNDIKSDHTTISNSVTSTQFLYDLYITFGNKKLLVEINYPPGGRTTDPVELQAINAMNAARGTGVYTQDVLHIDLITNTIKPNFKPFEWNNTSEGSIRFALLQMLRKMGG